MLTLRTTRPLVPSVFGRDFDRLFQGMFSPALMSSGHVAQPAPFPALNLSETEQAYQIEAELPGFAEADIEIQVNDDVLVLTGKRETQSGDDTTNYHRRERWSGTFERSLRLPAGIDAGQVAAKLSNGVLTITLPKPAVAQPRKISVTSA